MKVSPEIQTLTPYSPGKPISETKRELGLTDVYKLASNENPFGPSPLVVSAMVEALNEIHRYPDASHYELKEVVKNFFNITGDKITFGNGSNELIDLLIRTFCSPGEAILTSQGAFLAYALCAQAARVRTLETQLSPELCFDLEDLAKTLKTSSEIIRLVFIANPNNPTGTYVGRAEFENFMGSVESLSNILVVVDEAYFEFVRSPDRWSALEYLDRWPQIVCLRTMSKVYGLAGIRLGILFAQPEIVDWLNRVRNPFNVNVVAQKGAIAAIHDQSYVRQVCSGTWDGLDYFYLELKKMGINYWPSQANFILFDTGQKASHVFKQLLKNGIIMRTVENYGWPSFLRMSVGKTEENIKAIDVLTQVLK